MFDILSDKTICITRGDIAVLDISAIKKEGQEAEEAYSFVSGDIVRLTVVEKGKYSNVVLIKDVEVKAETTTVSIDLESADTRIGDIINKPVDYWYEIELNPDTAPQTIIGHDGDGPKIFRLYPEGGGFN